MANQDHNGTQSSYTNRLLQEDSPYLQQHAHNPVDWYPWGPEALETARAENKLLLISIGYSACHWCHVMEKESFMDASIAGLMNQHYVCIKVDREERPDVDQIYMSALQLMTGQGGWPLHCFALPDGEPVFGGTYFRPDEWKNVLELLAQTYALDPEAVRAHAEKIKQGVTRNDLIDYKNQDPLFTSGIFTKGLSRWKQVFDVDEGGNLGAPKFPLPNSVEFLLEYDHFNNDPEVFDHVKRTLDKMMQGGIFDHVEGGFARYSTDRYWRVPHFEKMLYDNAQMVSLYSKAFTRTGCGAYWKVVQETLSFIAENMTSPEGGFYSAMDADSEGQEGLYYVWSKEVFDAILGQNANLLGRFFNILDQGNWDQANVLYQSYSIGDFCRVENVAEKQFMEILAEGKRKLKNARKNKTRPSTDTKILTSWNALMMTGYLDAYKTSQRDEYRQKAMENAMFLRKRIQNDGRILRNGADPDSAINGFLDDYGMIIDAYLGLYTVTFDLRWLHDARKLTDYAIAHFYDPESGLFYYTSDLDRALIARNIEITDNVIPSSNSVMARNLQVLGAYFSQSEYSGISRRMLQSVLAGFTVNPVYYSNWAMLFLRFIHPMKEIIIMGPNARYLRSEFFKEYLPGVIFAGGSEPCDMPLMKDRFKEGEDLIYVCRNNACDLPVTTVAEALRHIHT